VSDPGTRPERILIVDDEESSRELCRLTLQGEGRELVLCPDASRALEELNRNPYDLVVTDMVMPGLTGMELLERIKAQKSDTPVVLMSGKGSIPTAVKAMRLGAEDFIEKPLIDPEVLALAVRRALRSRRLEEENRSLKAELQQLKTQPHLIGGEAMSQVMCTLERIAPLDLTVLITGETGTGKEVLARRLHALSPRAGKPFVALNCGGLPEGLLESLLFGHEKGAFTGAIKRTAGYFEKAHRGTILLDEIGDMPMTLQVKLLRVLQERRFQRVGGETTIEVDCRVLASTHRNLRRMVDEGTFREDLFYRLNVLNLHVPPLRERREDVPELARYFLRLTAARLSRAGGTLSGEAIESLSNYTWPGNVRELENVIERSVALTAGNRIEVADLPDEVRGGGTAQSSESQAVIPYGRAKEDFEKTYLLEVMAQSSGNVTQAAQISGIPRQNLYLKLKKYRINPGDSRRQ
jgi:two-component system nitrogen regulation response regulator NtrX